MARPAPTDRHGCKHAEVSLLLEGLSEAEILEPGRSAWTGKNPLVTYAGANTSSHYRFATKVIRRWLRSGADRRSSEMVGNGPGGA
jgi:hypothetical protein